MNCAKGADLTNYNRSLIQTGRRLASPSSGRSASALKRGQGATCVDGQLEFLRDVRDVLAIPKQMILV